MENHSTAIPGQATRAGSARQSVRDLRPGVRARTVLRVLQKRLPVSRNGSAYLAVTLGDGSGQLEGRAWDNAERLGALFEEGDFLFIDGLVEVFNGKPQLKLLTLERVSEKTIDWADFLAASRYDPAEMLEALRALVEQETQGDLRRILLTILADPAVTDRLKAAPAAKQNHHAYRAGLLEHTLSMARLAVSVAAHYRNQYPGLLDSGLLVAGTLLHDIGKIEELESKLAIDYTDAGRLMGHVAIGVELITRTCAGLGIVDDELVMRLKHMVLSHHGELEFGAPVKPQTPEAQVLHYIDQIDARLNMMGQAISNAGGVWTDFVKSMGRSFYVGKGAPAGPAAPVVERTSVGVAREPERLEPEEEAPMDCEPPVRNLDLFG